MVKRKRVVILLCMSAVLFALVGCGEKAASAGLQNSAQTDAVKVIEDVSTIQAFTEEAVAEADVTAIVNAGINAPSAMNGQPWHFSVITDKSTMEEINSGMSMGFAPGKIPSKDGEKPEKPDMPDGEKPEKPDGFDGEKPEKPDVPDGKMPKDFPKGDMPAAPGGGDPSAAKAGVADAPLAIVISCKDGSDLDAGLAAQNMSAEAQLLGYGTKIISSPTIALNGERQAEFKEMLGIPEDMKAVCVLLVGKTDAAQYDAVSSATTRNDAAEIVTYVK